MQAELGGRVYFRAGSHRSADTLPGESLHGTDWTTEEGIESARIEATFQWDDWLKFVVEGELEGEPRLKDAYMRGEHAGTGLRLTAGQFKALGSVIDATSSWTLPVPERGMVKDVLVNRLQIAGRRPELALEWRGPKPLRPTIAIGVFQASDTSGTLLESSNTSTMDARNFRLARASRRGQLSSASSGSYVRRGPCWKARWWEKSSASGWRVLTWRWICTSIQSDCAFGVTSCSAPTPSITSPTMTATPPSRQGVCSSRRALVGKRPPCSMLSPSINCQSSIPMPMYYWFAPGVGKIKEAGGQLEELKSYSLQE